MLNSVRCLGVINGTNVQCFFAFPDIFPPFVLFDYPVLGTGNPLSDDSIFILIVQSHYCYRKGNTILTERMHADLT